MVLFLHDGYASTSMEAVAASAGVSKRTLYKRFPDKAALLREAVASLITRWLPGFEAVLDEQPLQPALLHAARRMLAVALAPEALALHRLLVAEVARFPEIVHAVHDAGAAVGIMRIAALLRRCTSVPDPVWAAEQFQRLVLTGPQSRALGFGAPLSERELEDWARRSVALFLRGILDDATDGSSSPAG